MDAVKELAAEAGLEVPAPDPREAQQAEERAGLHEVTAAAQEWFRASLDEPEGARARAYLKSRGFDAHTVERFGFGYAPDGRNALKKALAQFDEAMLVEAGMLIQVEEREPYDRFRDRLTMPIHDARGRVIGFAGAHPRRREKGRAQVPQFARYAAVRQGPHAVQPAPRRARLRASPAASSWSKARWT